MGKLEFYADIVGYDVIDHLYQLSSLLKNIKVIHVNSTRKGGGVAEILEKLVPLSQELGIDTKWEVITGNERFFHCTKSMHNALQGPHPLYLIPPSIDPLSEKNKELEEEKVHSIYEKFNINPELPTIVQVSRFDRFKDPLGVIRAYRLAKEFIPSLQLILAGGGAADDPETEIVLAEVKEVASGDPNIHILFLPPGSDRIINAIQRGADIILQKSIREGFGLTVTEGMWKGKPVIGGNTGGIRLQVINHHTGFLVNTPEGAALRIHYLFHYRDQLQTMGISFSLS